MKHLATIAERNARLRANGFDLGKALDRTKGAWVRNGFYPDPALDVASRDTELEERIRESERSRVGPGEEGAFDEKGCLIATVSYTRDGDDPPRRNPDRENTWDYVIARR